MKRLLGYLYHRGRAGRGRRLVLGAARERGLDFLSHVGAELADLNGKAFHDANIL